MTSLPPLSLPLFPSPSPRLPLLPLPPSPSPSPISVHHLRLHNSMSKVSQHSGPAYSYLIRFTVVPSVVCCKHYQLTIHCNEYCELCQCKPTSPSCPQTIRLLILTLNSGCCVYTMTLTIVFHSHLVVVQWVSLHLNPE